MAAKKAKRALFVSGPALGHVTRLLSVATELQKIYSGDIEFVLPDRSRFANIIQTYGFQSHILPSNFQIEKEVDLDGFPIHLEALIKAREPDVIVVDCNLLRWCSVVSWPDIPRVLITNAFLTILGWNKTAQSTKFLGIREVINAHRTAIGLWPLEKASDLYDANIVCLADPRQVVNYFGQLPDHYRSCGSCLWQVKKENASPLPDIESALLFSLGSTGKAPIRADFVRQLKKATQTQTVIFATSDANQVLETGLADHAAEMYPLSELLPYITLAITQGGAGSTYQALSFGVPVAVYPWNYNQAVLGEILQEIGLVTLINRKDPLESIKNLDIKKLTENAMKFAESSKVENGQKEVARNIVGLLQAQKTGTRKGRNFWGMLLTFFTRQPKV